MYNRQDGFYKSIKLFIYLAACMQFALGLLWLFKNLTVYIPDPLSESYIQASKSLVVDDYMGILYAIFLKCFSFSRNGLGISIPTLYSFQIIILGVCIYSFVNTFFGRKLAKLEKIAIVMLGLLNPVSLQACCSVSPNALILSFVLCVILSVHSYNESGQGIHVAVLSFSSLALVFLLRDIGYFLVIFYLILGIVMLKKKRTVAITYLGLCLVMILGSFISYQIFEPYYYHRGRRSFAALAVQRINWNSIKAYGWEMEERFGYDYATELSKANQSPVSLFTDYFYTFEKNVSYEVALKYYKFTALRDLAINTRMVFDSFFGDLMLYIAPMLGVLWVYFTNTPDTLVSPALLSFTGQWHIIFWIFFTFYAMFTIVSFILCVYKLISCRKIKKYRLVIVAIIVACIIVAMYNSVATLRGFDYRNSLVVIVIFTMINLGYLLMDRD